MKYIYCCGASAVEGGRRHQKHNTKGINRNF